MGLRDVNSSAARLRPSTWGPVLSFRASRRGGRGEHPGKREKERERERAGRGGRPVTDLNRCGQAFGVDVWTSVNVCGSYVLDQPPT